MPALTLPTQRQHRDGIMHAGTIAAEQRFLLKIENNLAALIHQLFPNGCEQQLEIDMSVKQSLRHSLACLPPTGNNDETPFQRLAHALSDIPFIADTIVTKYLNGISLRKQQQSSKRHGVDVHYAEHCRQVSLASALLAVAHQTQLLSVLQSNMLHIDSKPIRCSHKRHCVLRENWFWPLYSENHEISFFFSPSPSRSHLEKLLERHYSGSIIIQSKAAFHSYRSALTSWHTESQADDIADKLWRFSGSEIGTEHTGTFKSLIANCMLHGLTPGDYLASALTLVKASPPWDTRTPTPREYSDLLSSSDASYREKTT